MQSLSRLDALAAAAAAASLVLPAADRRLAAPEPRKITAVLIAAAQKEGKVSCFSVVELPVAKKVAKAFKARFANLSVRVERSGAERHQAPCPRIREPG